MTEITIEPVTIPTHVGDADAADFIAAMQVRNRVYRESSGSADEDQSPAELLPIYRESSLSRRLLWLARLDGAPVARVNLDLPLEAGSSSAQAEILVLRSAWGRGVGSAALNLIEREARHAGRRTVHGVCEHPHDETAPRLAPRTGVGSVTADHAARFLTARSYTLEQVERKSVFDLSIHDESLTTLHDRARAAASAYDVVAWTDGAPDAWVDDYARMKSRMSTDAPSGELDVTAEQWDATRVREMEKKQRDAKLRTLVVAAVHRESASLVAFTELIGFADPVAATIQADTLVLREHRGHRLGMLVKTEALPLWRRLSPESPRVLTWNAEENRPMLSINEAMGFVPVASIGGWQKHLDADGAP